MFDEVQRAAERLKGVAHRTPVVTSRTLNETVGAEVFLKCENLQRVGAFKFRGAYNAISQLTPEERERGVLAYSSGNHAQGVALASKVLGVEATIVMPKDAPVSKLAATRGYGAYVVLYDREEVSRREVAAQLQEDESYSLIPPFDHPHIVAGQGTAALELFEDVPDLGTLLVPCGGAGLLSGCAVAASGLAPDCEVIGIEPKVADDATRSFYSGHIQTIKNPPTIADGTRTESVGEINFELMRKHVKAMRTVSEEAILEAVRFLFFRTKLVVEPSGALGVAALLSGAVEPSGRVGVILSGGNVDGATMAEILG